MAEVLSGALKCPDARRTSQLIVVILSKKYNAADSTLIAWLRCRSLKLEVRTTEGKTYRVRANSEIKEALWKIYKDKYLQQQG